MLDNLLMWACCFSCKPDELSKLLLFFTGVALFECVVQIALQQ